jgi:broad specificity phosphatase PhoE
VQRLFLARHGESTYSARGLVNGDPSVDVGLTPAGEEQARAMGRLLADEPIALCAVSPLRRTRETAAFALEGRAVPFDELPGLADPNVGRYEGLSLDEYRTWAWSAPSDEEAPGGGESRLEIVARSAAAYRTLLARGEDVVLAVAHALTVAYVLDAVEGLPPAQRLRHPIEYAQPFPVLAEELARALDVLDAWRVEPTW